jgi:hypothetical protein
MSDWNSEANGNEAGVTEEVTGQVMMTEEVALGAAEDAAGDGELVAQGEKTEEEKKYEAWLKRKKEPRQIEPPQMTIGQKDVYPGQLFCELTQQVYEEFSGVIIQQQKTRVRFPDKYEDNNPCLCLSNDGLEPDVSMTSTSDVPLCGKELLGQKPCEVRKQVIDGKMVTTCLCPYGQWAGGKPPRCTAITKVLILDVFDTMVPFWFSIKGNGDKYFKKLLANITLKLKPIERERALKGKYGAEDCLLYFTATPKKHGEGTKSGYHLEYSDVTRTPDELEEDVMYYSYLCRNANCDSSYDPEAVAKWKSENPLG